MSAPSQVLAVVNLDFEYELAAGPGYTAPPLMAELEAQWSSLLRLLPNGRHGHTLNGDCPPSDLDVRELIVWGVTPRTTRLAERLGLEANLPPVDLVRQINDKRTSHQLEQSLGIALPHSRILASLEQFQDAVAECPHGWVLKHPLGLSARERMVGKVGKVSESAWGWARRKFGQGWGLVFEPWVDERHDFSLHFQIEPDFGARYLGHCDLLPDPGGVYRGNRVTPNSSPPLSALRFGHQIAAWVAERGYWGPVGIDAFSGQLGGEPVLRPLVEINARHSFGRMTLALANWLPDDWCYLWWHPSKTVQQSRVFEGRPLPASGQVSPGVYSLPEWVDPGAASGTVLVTAPNRDELATWETHLGIPGVR